MSEQIADLAAHLRKNAQLWDAERTDAALEMRTLARIAAAELSRLTAENERLTKQQAVYALCMNTGGADELHAKLQSAEAERDQALDVVRELKPDAARYRFLRDESWKQPYAPGPLYRSLFDGIEGYANSDDLRRVWLKYEGALDNAIDRLLIGRSTEGKT